MESATRVGLCASARVSLCVQVCVRTLNGKEGHSRSVSNKTSTVASKIEDAVDSISTASILLNTPIALGSGSGSVDKSIAGADAGA